MAKKLTKNEAIARLIETRQLSTAMLEPLGFSMESFLQLSQKSKAEHDRVIDGLVAFYKLTPEGQEAWLKVERAKVSQGHTHG